MNSYIAEFMLGWITEILSSESNVSLNEGILQQGVPPINSDLIFGTGMYTGYRYEGIQYTSDSGYIRSFIAGGVIGFIIYYWGILKLFRVVSLKRAKKDIAKFIFLCVILVFTIEYKEPFILKYIFPFTLITCMLFVGTKDSDKIKK